MLELRPLLIKEKANLSLTKDSIHLSFGPTKKTVSFNFDGTFERHNLPIKKLMPLTFAKICPLCNRNQGDPKPYGKSTIIETMYQQYFYSFNLMANPEDKTYTVSKSTEFVSYLFENCLYHVETSFPDKESKLYHGSRLEGMLRKTLPILNLKGAQNAQDFINKIKLVATFS